MSFYQKIKKETAKQYFAQHGFSLETVEKLVDRYYYFWDDSGALNWSADVAGATYALRFLKSKSYSESEALQLIPKHFGCHTAFESLVSWAEKLGLSFEKALIIAKEFSWLYQSGGLAYGGDFFSRIKALS